MKKIRIILATFFFAVTTLLFSGAGWLHLWFGWVVKVQFLPALLALDYVILAILLALTLLFGRIYCSIVCPLGVMQDIFSWFGKREKKNRYSYSSEKRLLRYGVLVVFVICLVIGFAPATTLLAPYSSYGRIVNSLFRPLYDMLNNALVVFESRVDSYHIGYAEIWLRSVSTFVVALLTFVVLGVLAWKNGRTYCNSICPVGTILSFFARFSLLRIQVDERKCTKCLLCEKNCKASAIDSKSGKVDYSRCIVCGDCIDSCKHGALVYRPYMRQTSSITHEPDINRRAMLTGTAMVIGSSVMAQAKMKVDGGLAAISEKQAPHRDTHITPPGSLSVRNMQHHCTACQLCVSACPNNVLRPSSDLLHFMQPELSFERGFCRPECTRCSEVCPTSAIHPIGREEKSATAIGHAVWISKNCIPVRNGDSCNACFSQCPAKAIELVDYTTKEGNHVQVPAVNNELCIGCGKCEYLCPARPFSAIYVEGNETHHIH